MKILSPKQLILILIVSLLIVNCNKPKINSKNNYDIDATTVKIIKNSKSFSELFSLTKTIKLETKEDCLVSHFSQIFELKENKNLIIFDHDRDEVFAFDSTGKFIKKIGRKGGGPDEFSDLKSGYCSNNNIYIGDLNKLIVFDSNGNYIRYYNLLNNDKLFLLHKFFVQDNILVAYQSYPGNDDVLVTIYSLSEEKIISEFGKGENNYSFKTYLLTQIDQNNYLFSSAYSSKIKQVNTNNFTEMEFATLSNAIKLPESFRKLKNPDDQIMWLINHREQSENFKPFVDINKIDDFIFVEQYVPSKGNVFSIFDLNGTFLNTLNDFSFSADFKNLNFFDKQIRYVVSDGLIVYGFQDEQDLVKNPTLFFYKLK